MQAKKQVISNLKQEAHASWAEVKQQVLHLQEENCSLRHDLEVSSALCSRLLEMSACEIAATNKDGFNTILTHLAFIGDPCYVSQLLAYAYAFV